MSSLSQSIREALDVLREASNLEYALTDLHKESGGKPTPELAAEIAADYAGVNADKLMAAYPDWVQTQSNLSSQTAAKDPKKAAMAAQYQANQSQSKAQQDLEAKRAEKAQAAADKKAQHQEENAHVYQAAQAEIDKFKNVPGWTEVATDPDSLAAGLASHYGSEAISVDNGDGVTIGLWYEVDAPWKEGASTSWEIHGDVSFKAADGRFTFTRRGIDIDSFSYKEDSPEDPAAVLQKQVDRVAESRSRMDGQVVVPTTGGIRVGKDDVQKIVDTVRKGGTHTLAPAGMGVGYTLSNKRRHQWSQPASAEMKQFFGLDPLFIDQEDFD